MAPALSLFTGEGEWRRKRKENQNLLVISISIPMHSFAWPSNGLFLLSYPIAIEKKKKEISGQQFWTNKTRVSAWCVVAMESIWRRYPAAQVNRCLNNKSAAELWDRCLWKQNSSHLWETQNRISLADPRLSVAVIFHLWSIKPLRILVLLEFNPLLLNWHERPSCRKRKRTNEWEMWSTASRWSLPVVHEPSPLVLFVTSNAATSRVKAGFNRELFWPGMNQ